MIYHHYLNTGQINFLLLHSAVFSFVVLAYVSYVIPTSPNMHEQNAINANFFVIMSHIYFYIPECTYILLHYVYIVNIFIICC